MKSCKGCRHLFEGKAPGDQIMLYCRALPPVMRVYTEGENLRMHSHFPFAPKIRCGLFKRFLWPWRRTPRFTGQ